MVINIHLPFSATKSPVSGYKIAVFGNKCGQALKELTFPKHHAVCFLALTVSLTGIKQHIQYTVQFTRTIKDQCRLQRYYIYD